MINRNACSEKILFSLRDSFLICCREKSRGTFFLFSLLALSVRLEIHFLPFNDFLRERIRTGKNGFTGIFLSLAFACYRYGKLRLIKSVQLMVALVAMIVFTGLSILFLSFWHSDGLTEHVDETDYIAVGIFAIALMLMCRLKKLDPVLIMIAAGAGIILYSLFWRGVAAGCYRPPEICF